MRFALNNNELKEAQPGLKGFCRGCDQPVIAKCGTVRVHHWAHESTRMCDKWWEAETQWHRTWKDHFPQHWQECFMPDHQTGEKHIADVKTEHGLVIEFQHSHLNPQERATREKFYRNMVWIVDCTRLIYDYPRFVKGHSEMQATSKPDIFHVYDLEKCFPSAWLNSAVPVIFDFKGAGQPEDPLGLKEPLYCLFPIRVGTRATIARISRSAFIKAASNGQWLERAISITGELLKEKRDWQTQQEISEKLWQLHQLQMQGLRKGRGYGRGRRF